MKFITLLFATAAAVQLQTTRFSKATCDMVKEKSPRAYPVWVARGFCSDDCEPAIDVSEKQLKIELD